MPGPRAIVRALVSRSRRSVRRSLPGMLAIAIVAVVVGGVVLGYRFVTQSQKFRVARIEIRGAELLTDDYVASLLSIREGENIFRVDLAALADTLERAPWIARASVRRELPGTLLIDIEEHRPAALVELGGLYLADAAGVVFKRASTALGEGAGLPVITGLAREDYVRDPAAAQARLRDGLDAWRLYQGRPTRREQASALAADRSGGASDRPAIGEVHLDPRRGVVFVTYDAALAIRVGSTESSEIRTRLRAFDAAWAALSPRERASARIVYADQTTRGDRVTVGF